MVRKVMRTVVSDLSPRFGGKLGGLDDASTSRDFAKLDELLTSDRVRALRGLSALDEDRGTRAVGQ